MSESFHWHEAYMTGLTTPLAKIYKSEKLRKEKTPHWRGYKETLNLKNTPQSHKSIHDADDEQKQKSE